MPKVTESKLTKALKGVKQPKQRQGPLWLGPMDASPTGGITQSMLNNFLCCRERFRLKYIEGLKTVEKFSASIDFGNFWHLCEERHSTGDPWDDTIKLLKAYALEFCSKHPLQQEEINKWYNVCKTLFPIYVNYWSKDKEQQTKTLIFQEQVFHVPYELPSGRVVYLRGKFDAVDLIGKGKSAQIFLQENKTKSEIDEEKIRRNLKMDLQTLLYLIALKEAQVRGNTHLENYPIAGVRYNVIRRPLAGGKGSIRPHQATKTKAAETDAEFYERLKGVILEDVGSYFLRVKVEVYQSDIDRFKKMCLNPLLEQLCDWYDFVKLGHQEWNVVNKVHFMSPFGLYSPLVETGQTELDNYLENGSEVGLQRVETLFTELQ